MNKFDKWLSGLPKHASVADAARVAIASRAEEVASRLALAEGEAPQAPEHVHQLRVAARRTAALLKVYKNVLPERHADKLAGEVRRVRRAVGPARDLDVFRMRLQQQGILPGLQGRLYAQREAVQGDIQTLSDRLKRGKTIRRRARELVRRTPGDSKCARRAAKKQFGEWAPKAMRREVERFLAAAPSDDTDAAQLHAFRISAKRLRYAFEVLADGLDAGVRHAGYPLLKGLQDRLGEINDHDTAIAWLGDAACGVEPGEAAPLRDVIAREELAKQAKIEGFSAWWSCDRKHALVAALRGDCC